MRSVAEAGLQTLGWFALALAARSRLVADPHISLFFVNGFTAVAEACKDAGNQPRQNVGIH